MGLSLTTFCTMRSLLHLADARFCASLTTMDGDIVTAEYMPEKRDSRAGVIELNRATGDRAVVRRSEDDDMPLSWYVSHAFAELLRMLESEPPRMTGASCWY